MKHVSRMSTIVCTACGLCTFFCGAAMASPVFDIPRLEAITIDGDADDWGDQGFRVDIMASRFGIVVAPADCDPQFRLGWNADGLLVLCTVRDDVFLEGKDLGELDHKDCVEFCMAEAVGAKGHYLIGVAPGINPAYPGPRTSFFDWRTEKPQDLQVTTARSQLSDGYQIETLLPWSNLGIQPAVGTTTAFQLRVIDTDSDFDEIAPMWFPGGGDHADSMWMYTIRLADTASPAVQAIARANYDEAIRACIELQATPSLAGKSVVIQSHGEALATDSLTSEAGRSGANIRLAVPEGREDLTLDVFIDGEPVAFATLPSPDASRAKAFMELRLHFDPYVFMGTTFPTCQFEKALNAEQYIGRYAITTAYYDRDYNQVEAPTDSGRYGSVITVTPEKGRPIEFYRTLCYIPESACWYFWRGQFQPKVDGTFPPELGITPSIQKRQAAAITGYFGRSFVDGFWRDPDSAVLLCGLMETEASDQSVSVGETPYTLDHQWWLGLKRKLNGMKEAYPNAFICPGPIEGEPATVLHEGTLAEAGMKPDAGKNIDAVCSAWAADSVEAFSVCVARHGVIVLDKAYGMRDGEPVTVDTKSWMASITKMLSASLMWMAVDQGLVRLDDPVAMYLPVLRDIAVEKEMTIRHLYTHTAGLSGHWGGNLNDLENRIAFYYPYLQVADHYEYEGCGPALGSRVLEMITGESLPVMYQKHLFGPLGCAHTEATGSAGDAMSTARDIATFGQMILNGGAYGAMRFFTPDTLEQMTPKNMSDVLGQETDLMRGIGTESARAEGLGLNAFGHGAASSTFFCVDPDNDLVVVMARNMAGDNFDKYHPQFVKAIVDGMQR